MKKKNLMRLLSLGLTAVMAFSCLTGCGKSESTGSEKEDMERILPQVQIEKL